VNSENSPVDNQIDEDQRIPSGVKMCFIAMIADLDLKTERTLTYQDTLFAHSAVMNAISREDERLGHILHDMHWHKPMTLTLLKDREYRPTLRMTFLALDGTVFANLLMCLFAHEPALRIGDAMCTIRDIHLVGKDWTGVSTWEDLQQASTARHIRFQFATPTAITKRGNARDRYMSLLPAPLDIFMGLMRRWQSLNGPTLPSRLGTYIEGGGVVVAKYELHTEAFRTAERTQIGFLGSVVYECLKGDIECNAVIHALSRLAFFSGIGYQTARGMGATKVDFLG
jgi:CRISPR-associated endoribonuclease Cas6